MLVFEDNAEVHSHCFIWHWTTDNAWEKNKLSKQIDYKFKNTKEMMLVLCIAK